MLTYRGAEWVGRGTYVGIKTGEWVTIPRLGGFLPGRKDAMFLRMPIAALAAPVLGLAYLLFLPLAGFIMGGGLMLWKVGTAIRGAGRQGARAEAPRTAKP